MFETGVEPDEWNWRSDRGPHDVTRQICNAWKSDKLIKQLVCNPVIGECISKLMGWNGARLIQDNVLWKPPQGKPLNYHQDAAYDDWIIPQTMATCWITLDDAYIDNGGLTCEVTETHDDHIMVAIKNNYTITDRMKMNLPGA